MPLIITSVVIGVVALAALGLAAFSGTGPRQQDEYGRDVED